VLRQICFAASAASVLCVSAALLTAETVPDPVTAAFREYKSAQNRHDWPAAEAAAKRALSASEAQGGDQGVTAILAMNLALAEMNLGHKEEAIAPTRRALELARNGAKGVDQLTLRLMLGEAELSTVPTADEHDLLAALHAADGRKDLDSYAYPAAVTLTTAAQHMQQYDIMLQAAKAAELHAGGSGMEIPLAQGRALISQGIALASVHEDENADKALNHALELLSPLAPEAADDGETIGELSYAEALAVHGAVLARMISEGKPTPARHKPPERPDLKDRPPTCPGSLIPTPLPEYPGDMAAGYSVGSVVLRASVNAKGDVTSVRPLAIFPESSFRQSVMNPKIKWTFKAITPVKNCRVESTDRLMTVHFLIG
jgi:tetratricopeptide (TPR) repeat protein